MAANKSQALIVFTYIERQHKRTKSACDCLGKFDFTNLPRAKHVVSICSSTTMMHSYIHRQLVEYLLHYTSLPSRDVRRSKMASQIQTQILFVKVYLAKYQSQLTRYLLCCRAVKNPADSRTVNTPAERTEYNSICQPAEEKKCELDQLQSTNTFKVRHLALA